MLARGQLSGDCAIHHATEGGDSSQKVDAAICLDIAQDRSHVKFRHRGESEVGSFACETETTRIQEGRKKNRARRDGLMVLR
jgi:hypothetical protein